MRIDVIVSSFLLCTRGRSAVAARGQRLANKRLRLQLFSGSIVNICSSIDDLHPMP